MRCEYCRREATTLITRISQPSFEEAMKLKPLSVHAACDRCVAEKSIAGYKKVRKLTQEEKDANSIRNSDSNG